MREEEFTRELASLLNRTSAENGSNTPDFVLADYLRTCLRALDEAINARSKWYGRSDSPGSGAALTPPGHVLVGPECEARIADAMGCRCHIEITRVHGFPQSHAQECDVPRVLRAIGVRGGA